MMSVYETIGNSLVDWYGVHFGKEGESQSHRLIAGLCVRFGDEGVFEAWRIACAEYDNPVTALSKLGGILYDRGVFSSFIEKG